ncbi:MAG: glycosyltransferase [Cytophagales bacterium]|nr:MAG: glycosyltransferase [Cytophagales bacterium]TAF60045.1 MAG: glycosyltransferase [Cytophagales bacterium]
MTELDISVVVPLLNEAESLPELHDWICRVMKEHNYSYEILFIDDGSTDDSWKVIKSLREQNTAVRAVSFLRNYGKSAALAIGFERARGRVVITMDADLQDSPDEIPELYQMITVENYDLVSGWKKKRYDPLSKTIPTRFFNGTTRLLSGIKLHDFNCGLKAYKFKVVKNIDLYGEMHRYIPVLAKWSGFKKIGEKVVQHRPRQYGVTKFGLERFVNGFLDLLSVTFITRFRKKPMHFFGLLGTLSFLVGFIITLWLGIEKQLGYNTREVVEQPVFYLAVAALIIGTQLFLAGFLAEMVVIHTNRRSEYKIEEQL